MDDLHTIARHDRKRDALGQYAECAICHETDIRMLRSVTVDAADGSPLMTVLCASHHIQLQGKQSTEKHHLAGRANSPIVVAIPANDHAVLTDLQQDWPRETWRNPDGSPLLMAAGALRGWLDVLRLMLERTVGWIPTMLEDLDQMLRITIGSAWWTMPGYEVKRPS